MAHFVRRLIEITSRQQQTQRTLLGWLRVEYEIQESSNKLLTLTDLDSNTWVSEVKRLRGKKQPLSSAGLHALRNEYTRTIEPARALAAEPLELERTLSDLVNQAYALTPAEIALMWKTAPHAHFPTPTRFPQVSRNQMTRKAVKCSPNQTPFRDRAVAGWCLHFAAARKARRAGNTCERRKPFHLNQSVRATR